MTLIRPVFAFRSILFHLEWAVFDFIACNDLIPPHPMALINWVIRTGKAGFYLTTINDFDVLVLCVRSLQLRLPVSLHSGVLLQVSVSELQNCLRFTDCNLRFIIESMKAYDIVWPNK